MKKVKINKKHYYGIRYTKAGKYNIFNNSTEAEIFIFDNKTKRNEWFVNTSRTLILNAKLAYRLMKRNNITLNKTNCNHII